MPTADLIYNIFKARTDIYAQRWSSKKNGRKGYSPACANLFDDNLCRKTNGGTCRGCPGKKYLPYTQEVVKHHLSGDITAGVYPLLEDNTTWWLAVDFDNHNATEGKNPFEDAKAYMNAAQAAGIPSYLERSRGGAGAHAWIFFEAPVPAWLARRAGMALAMFAGVISYDKVDKNTFDRFFPNQDKHKGEKIGNLIALPYSGESTFLDPETLEPLEDQDAFLQAIERVPQSTLEALEIRAGEYMINWSQGPMLEGKDGEEKQKAAKEKKNIARILACDFLRWCEQNPKQVTEPLWYAMISNLVGYEQGPEHIHRISALDPDRYSEEDTDAKIEQAREKMTEYGPHTCEYIVENGFQCPRMGLCKCNAPAGLSSGYARVVVRQNAYWRRGDKADVCISNFVMHLTRTYRGDEGMLREVVLQNDLGQRSEPILLDADNLGNALRLRTMCLNAGNYIFHGNNDDVADILRGLFSQAGQAVELPRIIGQWNDLWLYENGAIDASGAVHAADSDGIIKVGQIYVKPQNLTENGVLPRLPTTEELPDVPAVVRLFHASTGTMGAWAALGWMLACLFNEDIFRTFHCFPFLFMEGRRRSGKSTIVSSMMPVFGYRQSPELAIMYPNTTAVGIERALSFYAGPPLWIDEYRASKENDREGQRKEGVMRAAYNRMYTIKGQTSPGAVATRVRAPVVLCGELPAEDSALRSRCTVVSIDENAQDVDAFRELQKHVPSLPQLGLQVLKMRTPEIVKSVLANITAWRDELLAEGLDARAAVNYAIACGTFEAVLGQHVDRDAFFRWGIDEARNIKIADDSETPVQQFVYDLAFMIREGVIQIDTHYKVVDEQLRLRFYDVHQFWQQHCRSVGRRCPLRRTDLANELEKEIYVLGFTKTRFGSDSPRSALAIDLVSKDCPDVLTAAVEKGDMIDYLS